MLSSLYIICIIAADQLELCTYRRKLLEHFSTVFRVDISFRFNIEIIIPLKLFHRTAAQTAHIEAVNSYDVKSLRERTGFVLYSKDHNEVFVFALSGRRRTILRA